MDPRLSVLTDKGQQQQQQLPTNKSPPTGNKLLAFFGGGNASSAARRDEVSRFRLIVLLILRPLNALVLACGCGFGVVCAMPSTWLVSAMVVANNCGGMVSSAMVSVVWHWCLCVWRRVAQLRQSTK